MAYLESTQLNFQPPQHGMASVILLVEAQAKAVSRAVNTYTVPVGHCLSPCHGPVQSACTDSAFEFQELQGSSKTSHDLENYLCCCIF